MKPAALFLVLALAALAGQGAARRYTYSGNGPRAGTEEIIEAPSAGLAAADFTTYIGDGNPYRVAALATDAAGNTYVAGSRVFPGPFVNGLPTETTDVFVSKLDPAGNLLFTATLSGKGTESASAIAVDAGGSIYVAGRTTSRNFPLHKPLLTTPAAYPDGGFLVKLGPDGSHMVYSTYFWGAPSAIAVDSQGNVFLTGSTENSAFPTTPGLLTFNFQNSRYAFVAKVAAGGDRLVYGGLIAGGQPNCAFGSSCFLASRWTGGSAIAIGADGSAYIAGETNTVDLPTTPSAYSTKSVGAFVAKIKADGSGLAYLTYVSQKPPNYDWSGGPGVSGLTVDSAGRVLVVGGTFEIRGPQSPEQPPDTSDVLVLQLAPDGSSAVWKAAFGGTGEDWASGVAVDPSGGLWITGTTSSPDFPKASGGTSPGDFLVRLNPAGSALTYSAQFPRESIRMGVALDPAGRLHLASQSGIIQAFTPLPAFAARVAGLTSGAGGELTGEVSPGEVISIYGPHIGPPAPLSAVADQAGFLPKTLGGVEVRFDGLPAPLLYVSDTQINAVVPFGVKDKTTAVLRLVRNGQPAPDFGVRVVPARPAIFLNADGTAAAVNQDGTLNTRDNPAPAGSVVTIWATGLGAVAAEDGQIATSARPDFIDGWVLSQRSGPVEITYKGAAPGMVAGVTQINFRVPAETGTLHLATGDRVSRYTWIN